MIKGGGVLQLLEEGLCPFSGETGLGAREYIHVAKAGSWGFQCHTQAVPRNGSSGGQPLSRPESRAHLTGWH